MWRPDIRNQYHWDAIKVEAGGTLSGRSREELFLASRSGVAASILGLWCLTSVCKVSVFKPLSAASLYCLLVCVLV